MDDIDRFLNEDLGDKGDITSDALFSNQTGKAKIICHEDCIISGIEEINVIFSKNNVDIRFFFKEGDSVKKNQTIATLNGNVKSILKTERLVLNFLSRMSGISTETNKLVNLCKRINPNIKIAATRKTTPGFRRYEKKAVEIGGGESHRFGLFDEILIKDNHLKISGSIKKTINRIREKLPDKLIEIEVTNEEDGITAAELNADIIMLDNFKPESARQLTKKIKKINPKILIEISGGINEKNILKYTSFADRISLGYITHSVKSINFSLEFL